MSANTGPIYVIGRQHSGNTMLTSVFGRHPEVHAFRNEDRFFEHVDRFPVPASDGDVDRLTDILADAHLPPLQAEGRQRIHRWLQRRRADRSSPLTASSLYREAKDWLASQAGKRRWAQKATSYVFHVEALLDQLPHAKLVFLVRNPLDIAASLRIRESDAYWLRMCIGWRKGVERARYFEKAHPENFLVVRYEDLVRTPEDQVPKIFRFCGLEFHDRVLSVGKVNPAESPFERSTSRTGISGKKVGYHREHLSPAERAAVVVLTGSNMVRERYPDLVDDALESDRRRLASMIRLAARGTGHIVSDLVRRGARDPGGTLRRFWRRLRQ